MFDHEKRWKTKKEQFDDLISKTNNYINDQSTQGIERAHLENSIFSKFGWSMPVEAVTFLINKNCFPFHIETFHKSRRSMAFKNGGFESTQGRLGKLLASPTDSYINAYERIGISLTFGWAAFSAFLLVANIGLNYQTITTTAIWAITSPLVFFVIYILGATLADMRRDRALLSLNLP